MLLWLYGLSAFDLILMVRRLLFLLFFLSLSPVGRGAGYFGQYFIEGRAGVFHREWLSNDTLRVRLGRKEGWGTVITDSSGHFRFSVTKIAQGCIIRSLAQSKRVNKRVNPKWIFIVCRGVRIKIRNAWDFIPFDGVYKTNIIFPRRKKNEV